MKNIISNNNNYKYCLSILVYLLKLILLRMFLFHFFLNLIENLFLEFNFQLNVRIFRD
jgi:hypothetical protein